MLSEHKIVLRLAEFFCIGAAVVCFGAACLAKLRPARAAHVEGLFLLALAGVFGMAVLAALLLNEFSRELHYRGGVRAGADPFASHLFGFVRRYAPAGHKRLALVGALLLALAPLLLGTLSWSSDESFEAHQAAGFMLVLSSAFLVLLPVFAATARLPGAFEDHASVFGGE